MNGSCHCGAVRFEAEVDLTKPATSCNCSICARMGWVLSFVPAAAFRLLAGEEALTDYQFGKKKIHHLFCRTCGVHSFSRGAGHDGAPMYAVNLRCLADVDLDALTVNRFDGKKL